MIEALRGHRLVLLDSCIWIYHLERNPDYVDLTRMLLRQVATGDCRGISSELTLLEIQMAPIRQGQDEIAGEYEILLDNFPNLTLQPVDRNVLHRAVRLRARYKLKAPDAIILATGLELGASLAVTNDKQWKRVKGIDVVCLADYGS